MRLIIGFHRRAILERQGALLPWLWREPVHDLKVLYAKGRRVELVEQILATAEGNPAPDEFVAQAAEEVASLPLGERRASAWRLAHNLVIRAILARQLLEES